MGITNTTVVDPNEIENDLITVMDGRIISQIVPVTSIPWVSVRCDEIRSLIKTS